jgi:hypothetical protein
VCWPGAGSVGGGLALLPVAADPTPQRLENFLWRLAAFQMSGGRGGQRAGRFLRGGGRGERGGELRVGRGRRVPIARDGAVVRKGFVGWGTS